MKSQSPCFFVKENSAFEFFELSGFGLKSIVRQLLSLPTGKTATATSSQLLLILGRLRALNHAVNAYNKGVLAQSAEFIQYWKPRVLNQLSGFGFQPKDKNELIEITGLSDLITQIELINSAEQKTAREMISNGQITFDALAELYLPGTNLVGKLSLGTPGVFRVTECFYDEKRSLLGTERSFHLGLEFVASMGDHFAIINFSETLSGWTGIRTRSLSDLTYVPLSVSDPVYMNYIERGKKYIQFAGAAHFVCYGPGSFFMHGRKNVGGLPSSGRVMIDFGRGEALGHNASQGNDEPTLALIQMASRYRRWKNQQQSSEGFLIFDTLPNQDWSILCWPALVGFSFSAKCWGHVLVSGLSAIEFRDDAFDQLVLAPERKLLIRALVRFGGSDDGSDDIIGGKSGGSVFLLHGPPGVGKTLTAEAIAELLHRPLYYVSMGELGTTPGEMETSLGSILDLCAGWNALVLLDEADVFLETRSNADLTRNAMVCVMLRLLEYHPGILFLTTNRVKSFDPAFESRVTVALRYEQLTVEARSQVWKNLLTRVKDPGIDCDVSYHALAKFEMNGRQIKNAVRLAVSLAREKGESAITQAILETTLSITSLGRHDMKN